MAPLFGFNNFSAASSRSNTPPKKYTQVHGVTKLNPAWKKWKEAQDGGRRPATTTRYPKQALPVVTNAQDHKLLCDANGGEDIPFAEATIATMEIMQEPEMAMAAGMQADEVMEQLGQVLSRYEVPMGLMNKLMILSEFHVLEFMVDDSGSMNHVSDTVDSFSRRPQTRWQEAQSRLKSMMEILAYVPFQSIEVCFLNRSERLILTRNGQTPQAFFEYACQQIDHVFSKKPSGTTPVLERLQESLVRGEGRNVSRYLFCDGVPNGGHHAKAEIVRLLMTRQNPEGNPMTFLSCTGEDEQVEWMKDAEEKISYCAECDDFNDEADEVYKDQGKALPFTLGFYLICSLVAAMNPNDLDAMDESVPFTKTTLDNLLGIQHDERMYRHYFDCFLQAQKKRPIERDDYGRLKRTDQLKKKYRWEPFYQDFLQAPLANQIPAVQEFKAQLIQ
mmetsp:Transcript_22139/g.38954  ORF Transcript_22139/g.38954 Transcript_22139/m.38954 type:complete len:446 (+) Transcript_22139:104-1441(+)